MKKVLAWAVALALVLSSFTMAFAADAPNSSQFKDADQIHYTEAVDVMVATGVINGYPDGTFGPAKTVKRSEMAKMIAVMMNGGEDIGDQYKGACPFADSKDHWAAGYIAYCAGEHIIDGRSADVFDPEAEVTGTEVAKMALTSLGYDSQIQGYVGENWAAAVLKDAKKAKLFDGLDKSFVPGDPCNRESAAQILFNCLQASMVEYETNTTVTVGDAQIAVSSKVKPVEDPDALYKEVFDASSDKTLEKDPKAKDNADEFGRPAHTWYAEGDKVGTYADSADYTFTAKDAPTVAAAIDAYDEDLADDIEGLTTFKIKVNGGAEQDYAASVVALGDTVEIYEKAKLIVVVHYDAYQITDVDTDVSDTDAEDGITAYVTLQNKATNDGIEANSDMAGYVADAYVENAVIAVATNGEDSNGNPVVIDSYVLEELANGTVTKLFSTKAATINGTKYDFTGSYTGKGVDGKQLNTDEDATFALYDYNGYAITSVQGEEPEPADQYGVLVGLGNDTATFGKATNYVKVVKADGNEATFALVAKAADFDGIYENYTGTKAEFDPEATGDNAFQPQLITYTLNDDNEINSIKPATGPAVGTAKEGKKIASGGTLVGTVVADDVVAFLYDKEADEWVVYGYSDLASADGIYATQSIIDADNEYVALYLGADLTEADVDNVYGFVSEIEEYTVGDKAYADITMWVEGKEKTYTTAEDKWTAGTKFDAKQVVIATLNSDGDIKSIIEATPDPQAEPVDEIAEGKVVEYSAPSTANPVRKDTYQFFGVDDTGASYLQFGTGTAVDRPTITSNATVYQYDLTKKELSVSSLSKIKVKNNAFVKIYQVDADSEAWNIVVFYNAPTSAGE